MTLQTRLGLKLCDDTRDCRSHGWLNVKLVLLAAKGQADCLLMLLKKAEKTDIINLKDMQGRYVLFQQYFNVVLQYNVSTIQQYLLRLFDEVLNKFLYNLNRIV